MPWVSTRHMMSVRAIYCCHFCLTVWRYNHPAHLSCAARILSYGAQACYQDAHLLSWSLRTYTHILATHTHTHTHTHSHTHTRTHTHTCRRVRSVTSWERRRSHGGPHAVRECAENVRSHNDSLSPPFPSSLLCRSLPLSRHSILKCFSFPSLPPPPLHATPTLNPTPLLLIPPTPLFHLLSLTVPVLSILLTLPIIIYRYRRLHGELHISVGRTLVALGGMYIFMSLSLYVSVSVFLIQLLFTCLSLNHNFIDYYRIVCCFVIKIEK